MTSSTTFLRLVLGLFVASNCLRATGPVASATLHEDAPSQAASTLPWAEPRTASGWRLYREGDDRRELTQHWVAGQDSTCSGIALAIQAGTQSLLADSVLNVRLTRSASASRASTGPAPLEETVFNGTTLLPPNTGRQAYKRGRWLVVSFPAVRLEAGAHYALHLAFAHAQADAQSLVFAIAPLARDDTTFASGFSQDGTTWKWWREKSRPGALLMHLITGSPAESASVQTPASSPARTLRVDPRDPDAFPSLKAATSQLRAGDTLWIAPDSGPYREELYVTASGSPEAPIIIEGNGNEITGFDRLLFEKGADGRLRSLVPSNYPFALRHQGRRIPEDAGTRRFIEDITYDPDARTLTLGEGVSPDGWEISVRYFVVRIQNASHHHYRNLVASGARNDGFNLHGRGSGLLFENITGRDNLDEGFSAHDDIESEIRGGRFFGNDNGIYNIQRSLTRIQDVDIYDNLGIGLGVSQAVIEARNLRLWGNGMIQALVEKGGAARGDGIRVYRNPGSARAYLTYMESAKWTAPSTVNRALETVIPGSGIILLAEEAPLAP